MSSPGRLAVVLALALVCTVAACSIDRRSGDYACTTTPDCSAGRVCVDGDCVLGTIGGGDQCPPECTRCEKDSCIVECALQECARITCPAGWRCDFFCGAGNCNNIDCSNSECSFTCIGNNACRNIMCGTKPCALTCTSRRACGDIDCEDSCACNVGCVTPDSCAGTVQCPLGCTGPNGGCSTAPAATCNTCE
ncbi:MAG: hypothetical protein R3B48_07860 [Kofleriaceae bacterium]